MNKCENVLVIHYVKDRLLFIYTISGNPQHMDYRF